MLLLILLLLSGELPGTYQGTANAHDQIARMDTNEQFCAGLRHRGSGFEQLANTCQYAVAAPHTLPDFVCTETVKRFFSPKQRPDIITAQLTVEKTRSHYAYVTVNGKTVVSGKTGDNLFEEKAGSTGEFAMLFNVFDASSQAEFAPAADTTVGPKRLKRYDFRVKRENNVNWTWRFPGSAINPGYHGSVFVDRANGEIFRLVVQVSSDEVDSLTPVSEATTTIDYSDVVIGVAGTHHVPVRGEAVSCFRFMDGCIRAAISFDNFHKFGADTRVLPVPQ